MACFSADGLGPRTGVAHGCDGSSSVECRETFEVPILKKKN